MNHEFSELQELLGQTARELFSRDFPLDRMRDGYRTDEGYDTELWPSIVDLGWNSAPFPEEMGGTGGGLFDTVLLLEEMGKGYCVSPYPHSTIAAGLALVEADADLAQAIAADEAVVIPALTAADGVTQMASRDGDGAITLTDRRLVVAMGRAGDAICWSRWPTATRWPSSRRARTASVPRRCHPRAVSRSTT